MVDLWLSGLWGQGCSAKHAVISRVTRGVQSVTASPSKAWDLLNPALFLEWLGKPHCVVIDERCCGIVCRMGREEIALCMHAAVNIERGAPSLFIRRRLVFEWQCFRNNYQEMMMHEKFCEILEILSRCPITSKHFCSGACQSIQQECDFKLRQIMTLCNVGQMIRHNLCYKSNTIKNNVIMNSKTHFICFQWWFTINLLLSIQIFTTLCHLVHSRHWALKMSLRWALHPLFS